jgi:hypothetical protein
MVDNTHFRIIFNEVVNVNNVNFKVYNSIFYQAVVGELAGSTQMSILSITGSGTNAIICEVSAMPLYDSSVSHGYLYTDGTLVGVEDLEGNLMTPLNYHLVAQQDNNVTDIQVKYGTSYETIVTEVSNVTGSKYVRVASGTTLAQLKESIESTDGSSQTYTAESFPDGAPIVNEATVLATNYTLHVKAADGVTEEGYTINVNPI